MGSISIIRDEETKSYVSEEIFKHLDTGFLKMHYRANTMFIIREKVLYGFKKQFLDSVDVFTIHGHFIGKLYRIRENEYHANASKEIVSKMLNEYLYSIKNRETLEIHLQHLYDMNSNNFIQETIVNNFVRQHEKH